MKVSNLKALLITSFCFIVSLCSEIKSMDTASDLQETMSHKAKKTNTEIDSDSSNALLLPNEDENKDPETSLISYIASPVKVVINGAYNIVDFAVKHPTQTVITSLLIAAQFTAVAAVWCDCYCGKGFGVHHHFVGKINEGWASCSQMCHLNGYPSHSLRNCNQKEL